MPRKTPVRLNRTPFTNRVVVLTNYRLHHVTDDGREIFTVIGDGKHDVTGDFESLLLETLMPDPKSDICALLDGVANHAQELTEDERHRLEEFRQRLVDLIESHNTRVDAKREKRNG